MIDCMKKYDYCGMLQDIHMLRLQYPDKLKTGFAGYSVCGRKLVFLSVGSGEKKLLLLGSHHGREYITTAFLMRLCEDYLEQADEALLRRGTLVLLPMVNPDGVELSIHGSLAADHKIAAMPRLNGTFSAWKANANGVDLNRNYPCLWEKKQVRISEPASEMYNGPCAASEPEVRAVMRFTEEISPHLAVTLHTKGEEIFYGDSNTPRLWEESKNYAETIKAMSGYEILPPSRDPAIYAAGYENWFREKFRRPCLLIEAGIYDGPEPFRETRFEAEIWQKLQNLARALMIHIIDT